MNFDRLKEQVEENPILAAATAALVVTSVARLISATKDVNNSRAWSKEVKRRIAAQNSK